MSGFGSHRAGLAAENAVAVHYAALGYTEKARRWRGGSGEIDFIAEREGLLVFVEVKYAATHAAAASRITADKAARLFAAASEYLAAQGLAMDADCRMDAALVDRGGRVELRHNAFL